jgi:hypothetical protein
MSVPAYHMRMKDLIAEQRTAYKTLRGRYAELEFHFNKARAAFRKAYHSELYALSLKQEEEKAALRKKHHDARERAKAEKAFIAESRKEADFWTYYPNHDDRRDTMEAVLRSLSKPVENLDKLMPAYAEWLLTAEKGKLSRWALMSAFATARL